jgi:hypothetical protein
MSSHISNTPPWAEWWICLDVCVCICHVICPDKASIVFLPSMDWLLMFSLGLLQTSSLPNLAFQQISWILVLVVASWKCWQHSRSWYVLHHHFLAFNSLTNKMVLQVDMLGSCVKLVVFGWRYCSLVVSLNGERSDILFHYLFDKASQPDSFLTGMGFSNIPP